MSRLPSEVKIADFPSTTQRNGDIITAISLPNANPGILVLVLRKCYIRSIFRQFERIAIIAGGGPAYLTIPFDKVKFFYTVGNFLWPATEVVGEVQRDHNYTKPIFGECSCMSIVCGAGYSNATIQQPIRRIICVNPICAASNCKYVTTGSKSSHVALGQCEQQRGPGIPPTSQNRETVPGGWILASKISVTREKW